MKLYDIQELTLCDHNSPFDLKIYESIHFLLYLLCDLDASSYGINNRTICLATVAR